MNIISKKSEFLFVFVLLILSIFPRVVGLGYSHYYGDEIKVLYLDKTIPATQFFLDQRKGPLQFLIAWTIESITNSFAPEFIRLPFAVAGIICVLLFYLVVKELSDIPTALIAGYLFSFNGFFIAFSRTVQYQSFLLLFGFFAIYTALLSLKYTSYKKYLLLISAASLALSFLSHYDAIWFLLPTIYILRKEKAKLLFVNYFLPLFILTATFYIPYIYQGYFANNTFNYVQKRFIGDSQSLPNNTIKTFLVYNPSLIHVILLFVGGISFFKSVKVKKNLECLVWFLFPFLTFGVLFKNPGTHILHFIIPLIILSSIWLKNLLVTATSNKYVVYFASTLFVFFAYQIALMYLIFIPTFDTKYPWANSKIGPISLNGVKKDSQLFLYGFNYNRNWEEIAVVLKKIGAREYYTNDNSVVAKYYVKDIFFKEPGTNFLPTYYVDVSNNQELKITDPTFIEKYTLLTSVKSESESTVQIYKLK